MAHAPARTVWLLAWPLIVLGVVYLTALGGGGFFGLYWAQFRITSVGIITVALGVWLFIAWRHPFWRPRSSLMLALAVSVAALGVCLALSERPRLGADFVAYAVLLTGAYLLLHRLVADPFFGPRLGSLAILLGYALCIVFVIRVFGHWIDYWSFVGRLTVPPLRPGFEGLAYGHPGTFATVVVLLWLASAAHLGFETVRARLTLAALGLLVAFVVFVSGARGAWLGIAAAVSLCGLAWGASPERRRMLRTFVRSPRVRVAGVLIVAGAVVLAVVFVPAVTRRLLAPAADVRTGFFGSAIRMFGDDPLSGQGPGMWTVDRAAYTLSSEQDYYVPHAHNLFLQTAAELGLVGIAAGVLVALAVGRLIWLALRSDDGTQRRFGWATAFAVVYLVVNQLFDFYANMPAIAFLFALLVARLDVFAPSVAPWDGSATARFAGRLGGRMAVGVLLVGTLLSAGWLLRTEAIALDGQRATAAANDGDWASALEAARRAVAADPGVPPYIFTLGMAAAYEGNFAEARDAFRSAAEIDDFPTTWLNVAWLELRSGDEPAARDALDRAMRLGYQNPQVALGAMTAYQALGDRDAAVSAAADALAAAPGLASDPTWQTTGDARDMLRAAVPTAIERIEPEIAYKVALEAGRGDVADAIVEAMADGERTVPRLVTRAWSGDADAFVELHALAMANPLDITVVGPCRRVAARSHDADWPFGTPWVCDGTWKGGDAIVRVSGPPEDRIALPGPNAPWHFQYVYRRPTPFDELLPGLPDLGAFRP
jgi:O-antigen ligase